MNKLIEKMSQIPTEQLKSIISELLEDYSDSATIMLEAGFQVLKCRISEKDFVRFCEEN